MSIQFENPKIANIDIRIHSQDIVPHVQKTLMKSGRISEKSMPKMKLHEIYQDYVSSATLRVANETFALLPFQEVIVTIKDNLLNPVTGHLEDQAILSVLIPRQTIAQLNLQKIDPSESLRNFIHEMNFTKSEGFKPVQAISKSA